MGHAEGHIHKPIYIFSISDSSVHISCMQSIQPTGSKERDIREMEEVLRSCTSLKAAIILSPIALSCQVEVMHLNFLPKAYKKPSFLLILPFPLDKSKPF